MKPLDYSFYNKVKEKFLPKPLTVIFVSLKPDNLEELHGISFTSENVDDFLDLIREYGREAFPYAAIGSFSQENVGYEFFCHEFEQAEDLLTGQILMSSIGTYNNNPPDIEALRKDLQKLVGGILLTGHA